MAKIIKNQKSPAADIEVYETGVTIPASGQLTIDPINYGYWATPEVITELTTDINSGDIVINDGAADLDAASGIAFLKIPDEALNQRFEGDTVRSNGFPDNITTQEAVEFAKTTVSGKMQDFEFTTTGVTQNKWVNISHPSGSSDDIPFIALWSGTVIGVSFMNTNDDASTDLEFYVNGTLQYTLQIRNKRWEGLTDETGLFNINQGDRISIFAKKLSGTGIINPSGISGEVMAVVSAIGSNSFGNQTGV